MNDSRSDSLVVTLYYFLSTIFSMKKSKGFCVTLAIFGYLGILVEITQAVIIADKENRNIKVTNSANLYGIFVFLLAVLFTIKVRKL